MDQQRQLAFQFAEETTKQLITLATGVLALTITFAKDVAGPVSDTARIMLAAAWFVYIVSLLFGLLTLSALTGSLEPLGAAAAPASIRDGVVVRHGKIQMVAFVIATLFVLVSGVLSSWTGSRGAGSAASTPARVQREIAGAVVMRDLAAVDTLLADGWVVESGDSVVLTKAALIRSLARNDPAPTVSLESAAEMTGKGGVVIATGRAKWAGAGGKPRAVVFTSVYEKESSHWKAVRLRLHAIPQTLPVRDSAGSR